MVPVFIVLFITGCILITGSFVFQFEKRVNKEQQPDSSVDKLLNQIEQMQSRLDNAAEETAGHLKSRTERELEKLSNEKIMAVSEYSEQVMNEINKNHQEVMFLYSMLSDKQKELDGTVDKLNRVKHLREDEVKLNEARTKKPPIPPKKSTKRVVEKLTNKEKILLMHQEGMSNLEIAKGLNLGVGEVRLVIDLQRTSGGQEDEGI